MREDRARAGNDMTFAPWWSEGCSDRFQVTLEIACGLSSCLCGELESIFFLEIENAQVESRRGARESLVGDHAVRAIRDPGVRVHLGNRRGQFAKGGHSDGDAATLCRCQLAE